MGFQDLPIKQKVMAVVMLTSVAVLLFTSAAFTAYDLVTYRQSLLRNWATMAAVVAEHSATALAAGNANEARQILAALRADPHLTTAALYDRQGNLFVRYPVGPGAGEPPRAPEPAGCRFERNHLIAFQPVTLGGVSLGMLYLDSAINPLYSRLRLNGGIALAVFCGSVLAALALSQGLARRISGPLLALADTAKAIAQHRDYSVRAPQSGGGELGLLTAAFNTMLTRIHDGEEQRRQLNLQLEQRVEARTADLTAVNRELEAFTYSVAHDLRAPLRHIEAFSKILQEEFAEPLPAEARAYLERIRTGSRHMSQLVDDLLNLARVSRQELRRKTVLLSPLVSEVIAELKGETQGRAIEWRLQPLPAVQCDAGLMKQVFANLLANAIKYTRPRSRAIIEVGCFGEKGGLTFYVRDNGVGFNMKYVDKLFGVFQRLHRTDEFEGTGVGLATVERIIRKHGGCVWAEGAVNKGAAFYFSLPAPDPAPALPAS